VHLNAVNTQNLILWTTMDFCLFRTCCVSWMCNAHSVSLVQ